MPTTMESDTPPDEHTSATSPTRRGRSGTITPAYDENYNETSPRRMKSLQKLHDLIHEPVPAPFWAVLMFSDVEMLERFVERVVTETFLLPFCMHACAAVPLIWRQKEPRPPGSASSSASSLRSSSNNRSTRIRNMVADRDGQVCVITSREPFDVAHIYPHFLIADRNSNITKTYPPFWNMLKYFWSSERIASWKDKIFMNPNQPGVQVDSVENQICLSKDIHDSWTAGKFVLRPLEYNEDKSTLDVEWHWQARAEHNGTVYLNTKIQSSRGLDDYITANRPSTVIRRELSGFRQICTGDFIRLTTKDPVNLPLPSKELLDMQFVLSRIVNLSGAGESSGLFGFDDDSYGDVPVILPGEATETIMDWLSSVGSKSDDEDDERTQLTSEFPSPVSTRKTQPQTYKEISQDDSTTA